MLIYHFLTSRAAKLGHEINVSSPLNLPHSDLSFDFYLSRNRRVSSSRSTTPSQRLLYISMAWNGFISFDAMARDLVYHNLLRARLWMRAASCRVHRPTYKSTQTRSTPAAPSPASADESRPNLILDLIPFYRSCSHVAYGTHILLRNTSRCCESMLQIWETHDTYIIGAVANRTEQRMAICTWEI